MSDLKSLKSINSPLLWGIVVLDATILALIELGPALASGAEMSRLVVLRAALLSIAPMAVLLLNSLLPAHWKARLVFWRWNHVLPGHRAFSYHATRDSRIDIAKLKKNVGAFPDAPNEPPRDLRRLFSLRDRAV
jgi:hypothetical protein